jgi:general secretion pathway protein D
MTRKFTAVLVFAVLVSGCAAGRAFRHGQAAMRVGDWDAAVTYLRKAVQMNPDSPEYKINLQRAEEAAAREHIEKAKALEQKDQLDGALTEYRRALELDSSNRLVAAKVAALEKTVRERIEATRPRPRIEQLREQARQLSAPPLLNPASREPIRLNFNTASLKDILNFIGTASGINITYDQQFVDKAYSVNLDGVTVEEALQQVLSANGYFYKVTSSRTVLIIPDNPQKHAQYDELVVRVFYISHADATELAQIVNSIMRIPQMTVQPMVMPGPKGSNTITVRATAPVVDVMERIIKANDKPRAEVVLDVEILEVSRQRVKQFGLNLNSYSLNLLFSPEQAPNASNTSIPPFNLNTISQGVSTADFYLGVPSAVVNFLESDNRTKTLAKPQLRGAEGNKLTLNLGSDIPVISTVFGAAAAGGFATIPQSSYTYRTVGVNLDMTPRVTYEGDILLDMSVENSALGANVDVAGQSIPSFTSRKVSTHLRLREGESNLLAGLLRQDTIHNLRGLPGLIHVPGLRQLLSGNDQNDTDQDIVMLITPHVVRSQELTAEDLGAIYIGTQGNVGLTGPPPLIAPQPGGGGAEVPPAAAAAPAQPANPSGGAVAINQPPPGVPSGGAAAPLGAQTPNPPAPPGTTPVPGALPAPTPAIVPPLPAPPVGQTPPVTGAAPPGAPAGAATPPGAPAGTPPTGAEPARPGATPPAAPPAPEAQPRPAAGTPAQVILTPPGTEFRVGGGPYTMPVSINNATRVSFMTLTITYNPAILRVRTVQDGTFMRQGGVQATFAPRINATVGRVDIAISRAADQTGASGSGLLAAVLFDAIAPGSSSISLTGVASTPEGTPLALTMPPVTVTVR